MKVQQPSIERLFASLDVAAQEIVLKTLVGVHLKRKRQAFRALDPVAEYLQGEVERKPRGTER